ncbi:MAG: UvrD-helicase domain-containing protein, partial [Eubacteriales bacterium]
EIINQSRKLIEIKEVRQIVGTRLHTIFVDEYQDATTAQHKIFDEIRKEGKTRIYCVGDPEQFILGFTYVGKQKPKYDKLPIFQLASIAEKRDISSNHRSTQKIVEFINNFNSFVKQQSDDQPEGISVHFLGETKLDRIVETFNKLCTEYGFSGGSKHYLAHESKTYLSVAKQYSLVSGSNESTKFYKIISDVSEVICELLCKSRNRLLKETGLELLRYRRVCLKLLEILRDDMEHGTERFITELCSTFGVNRNKLPLKHDEIIESLRIRIKDLSRKNSDKDIYLTIHKSKGLEAEAVLAVAKNNSQLEKWLETEPEKRVKDTSDQCRIGFVAFSRAQNFLCTACLEPIKVELLTKLQSLHVKII